MRAVIATGPAAPRSCPSASSPTPTPGPGEVLLDVVATGRQPRRHSCSARASTRRRPAPPTSSGWSAAAGRRARRGRRGLVGRRRGVRAAGRWGVRRAGGRAGRPADAGPGRRRPGRGGRCPRSRATVWSNVFMVADLQPRRDAPRARRRRRHRHHGDPARPPPSARGCITTAGLRGEARAVRALGADVTINYRDEDFVEVVAGATAGGADVILDNMGAKYLGRNVDALATAGPAGRSSACRAAPRASSTSARCCASAAR